MNLWCQTWHFWKEILIDVKKYSHDKFFRFWKRIQKKLNLDLGQNFKALSICWDFLKYSFWNTLTFMTPQYLCFYGHNNKIALLFACISACSKLPYIHITTLNKQTSTLRPFTLLVHVFRQPKNTRSQYSVPGLREIHRNLLNFEPLHEIQKFFRQKHSFEALWKCQ